MYSSDQSQWDTHQPGAKYQTAIEPLLHKFKVDMVVNGHMHCYERTWPNNNGTTSDTQNLNVFNQPSNPIWIVQGNAGAAIVERWIEPQPAWSAVRVLAYGYGRMSVFNSTSLYYESRSVDGTVVDYFYLNK